MQNFYIKYQHIENWVGHSYLCHMILASHMCHVVLASHMCPVVLASHICHVFFGITHVSRCFGVTHLSRCFGVTHVSCCFGITHVSRGFGVTRVSWCFGVTHVSWCFGVTHVSRGFGVTYVSCCFGVTLLFKWPALKCNKIWNDIFTKKLNETNFGNLSVHKFKTKKISWCVFYLNVSDVCTSSNCLYVCTMKRPSLFLWNNINVPLHPLFESSHFRVQTCLIWII